MTTDTTFEDREKIAREWIAGNPHQAIIAAVEAHNATDYSGWHGCNCTLNHLSTDGQRVFTKQDREQRETLTARDYQDAIDVQNGCNLSGIVFSFARVMQRICNSVDGGTKLRNRHPIAIMFASKIASLTGCEDFDTFSKAMDSCELSAKDGAR